jgi:hypothetical protein
MKWLHTRRSERDYRAAPSEVQDAFDKQARLLVADPDLYTITISPHPK